MLGIKIKWQEFSDSRYALREVKGQSVSQCFLHMCSPEIAGGNCI